MKITTGTPYTLIASLILLLSAALVDPQPASAGDKGFIFGRLNDKVMGQSWNGEGKLKVVVGDDEKNVKDFDMCGDGYVAAEVDAGIVKLDVIENKKEKNKEKREAYLNQPILKVPEGTAVYWGDVKIGFDYGSLTFRSEDKLEAAKAAIQKCLTEMGEEDLAAKVAPAPVEKQFVFVGMTDR